MDTAFRVVGVVGESPTSVEEAATVALRASSDRVHGLTWVEIASIRANVNDQGGIDRWQVTAGVAFKVDDAG